MTSVEKKSPKTFAPNPADKSGSSKSYYGGMTHSVEGYLQQLGMIPKLSAEELEALGKKIAAAELHWRKLLYSWEFAGQWHNDFLSGKDVASFKDMIMPSCLSDSTTERMLKNWRDKLLALTQAFEQDPANSAPLIKHLLKYKLSSDIARNCQLDLEKHCKALAAAGTLDAAAEERLKDLGEAWQVLNDLRRQMVEGNLRLVVRIVNQYSYRNLSVGDLIQEGNLGLMRSLEKFDFDLKHKFSTYASWWIKQSIGRALAEQFRIIRIPVHMVSTIAAINRVEQRFILEHDRMPEVEEIAAILEMPPARISAIRKMARQTVSLQSPLSGDSDSGSLEDILPDEQAYDPAQEITAELTNNQLQLALDELSPRERQIMIMRFGLLGEREHTLHEISLHFNISRERVRQLEMQTLNKLRTPENRKKFLGLGDRESDWDKD